MRPFHGASLLGASLLVLALGAPAGAMRAPVAPLDTATSGDVEPDSAAALFEASLDYRTGDITLGDGIATLRLGDGYRYLDPENAERLLVEGWGNPPGGTTLGMIVPADVSPLSAEGWAVVVTYDEDGYVEDDEAATIDYDALLREMQAETREESKERVRQGYEALALVGWAAPPRYDSATNKLYWAQELRFGTSGEHTLNYNIRVLGRRGVLVLNAIASMSQLETVEGEMGDVLGLVEFNPGHRYADFVPGTDKVAAYGIGALVAGKVAAKAGFFKVLLAGLMAMKKFVVVALLAIGAMLKRWFGRRAAAAATG